MSYKGGEMNDRSLYIKEYFSDLVSLFDQIDTDRIEEISTAIEETGKNNGIIFVFGNGGSASTASHMICDLAKNTKQPHKSRFRIICLNDSMPIFSAYANDEGYSNVFAEQIKNLGGKSDLAIAISGSGKSENILKGIMAAKEIGMRTVGITGFRGGEIINLADIVLCVQSDDIEQIEDLHLIINHILTGLLRGERSHSIKRMV
jgi:D-sedoheptulose 7-phosphate isomerase